MIANIHPALVLLAATAVFTAHAEDLTLCRQGLAATQRQDNERAISLYDACVKLGDLSPSSLAITYRNYANTYRQMAKPQLSIEFSDKAIALHPRDVAADHVNRGNALSDLGRYNDALEGFNVAASLAPNLADVHYNRGIVFERMKQAEQAKGEFLLAYQKGLRSKLLHERMSAHGLAEQGGTAPIDALATPSTSTAAAELPLAKNIGAVWNMTMQPCNGAGANAFQLHPSHKETVASKRVELRTLGAVLRVPQLPGVETTHIKLFLGDRTRGVVDNYVLLAEHDAFPPVAAVVITELPQQISTPDKALAAVAVLENQLIRKAGLSSKLERTSGPYGDALELVIRNRVGTHCFPTSDFKVLSQSSEGGTIGISRFVFAMGKLVEFSLIVRVPANLDEEAALSYSRELMDGFWLSLKPI